MFDDATRRLIAAALRAGGNAGGGAGGAGGASALDTWEPSQEQPSQEQPWFAPLRAAEVPAAPAAAAAPAAPEVPEVPAASPVKRVTFAQRHQKQPKRRRRLSPYNIYMRGRPAHVPLHEYASKWKEVPVSVKRKMAAEAAVVEAERKR